MYMTTHAESFYSPVQLNYIQYIKVSGFITLEFNTAILKYILEYNTILAIILYFRLFCFEDKNMYLYLRKKYEKVLKYCLKTRYNTDLHD